MINLTDEAVQTHELDEIPRLSSQAPFLCHTLAQLADSELQDEA